MKRKTDLNLFKFLILLGFISLLGACREQDLAIIDLCDESGCPSDAPPAPMTFCEQNEGKTNYAEIAGTGTERDPYIICFGEQIASLAADDNALTKHFRLVQDVNLSQYYADGGPSFQIGSCGQTNCEQVGPGQKQYTGIFDGAGYTIFGFVLSDRPAQSGGGLFAFLGEQGKVINVKLSAVEVSGNRNVGGLVGRNDGEIIDVDVLSGVLKVPTGITLQNLGGIAGINYGLIRDSQTSSSFEVPESAGANKKIRNLGGIVGLNKGVVRGSVNAATLETSQSPVGGIAGKNENIISNCINTGDILGNTQVGGIAGIVSVGGKVLQSSNQGNITKDYQKSSLIVQKFTNTFIATQSIGSAGSANLEFFGASDVAFYNGSDHIFVLEKENHRMQILKNDLEDVAVHQGNIGQKGSTLASSDFLYPEGLFIFEGATDYIMVADTGNNVIKKFNMFGAYQAHFEDDDATSAIVPANSDKTFSSPHDVAVDANENIFIADTGNHRIVSLDKDGNHRFIIGGSGPSDDPGEFNLPKGVAVDADGKIYVADTENHRIQVFNTSGVKIDLIGEFGETRGKFNHPTHITIYGDTLFVTDRDNNRIQVFKTSGLYVDSFGKQGNDFGNFNYPAGVAIDYSDAANVKIFTVDSNPTMLGGIAGHVQKVRFRGIVFDDDNDPVETIITKEGLIQNSYNSGNINIGSFTHTSEVGGIAGHSKGIIYNTYSNGMVNGNIYVGGLIGLNYGSLQHSFFLSTVNGSTTDHLRVGPLMGYHETLSPEAATSNFFINNYTSGVGSNCTSASGGTDPDDCNVSVVLSNGEEMGGGTQSVTNLSDKFQLPYRDTSVDPELIYWDFSNIWVQTSGLPTHKYAPIPN